MGIEANIISSIANAFRSSLLRPLLILIAPYVEDDRYPPRAAVGTFEPAFQSADRESPRVQTSVLRSRSALVLHSRIDFMPSREVRGSDGKVALYEKIIWTREGRVVAPSRT